jgi:hypothetical protein
VGPADSPIQRFPLLIPPRLVNHSGRTGLGGPVLPGPKDWRGLAPNGPDPNRFGQGPKALARKSFRPFGNGYTRSRLRRSALRALWNTF